MKLRIAALSFFLAMIAVGICWLTFQPLVALLLKAVLAAHNPTFAGPRIQRLLPLSLVLDVFLAWALSYLVLHLAIGRPLERTRAAVERLGSLEVGLIDPGSGPVLSRLGAALQRMVGALGEERARTLQKLEEIRAANERLAKTQAELVASERLATVGKLAAGVAHEVGNPLSGVLGYLSLLRQAKLGPDEVSYIDQIEAEVQRINQIVRGLLDLGRPAKGTPAPIELAPLVATCVRLIEKSPELRDVEIAVEVPRGLHALGETGPLSQILLNLLLNAGQAMGGRGRVEVNAAQRGARIALRVEDRGPGLSEEVQAHLFEPFFTARPDGKGTGLGLAISRRLAEGMAGSLAASNRPEGGARFTLDLPAASS